MQGRANAALRAETSPRQSKLAAACHAPLAQAHKLTRWVRGSGLPVRKPTMLMASDRNDHFRAPVLTGQGGMTMHAVNYEFMPTMT